MLEYLGCITIDRVLFSGVAYSLCLFMYGLVCSGLVYMGLHISINWVCWLLAGHQSSFNETIAIFCGGFKHVLCFAGACAIVTGEVSISRPAVSSLAPFCGAASNNLEVLLLAASSL